MRLLPGGVRGGLRGAQSSPSPPSPADLLTQHRQHHLQLRSQPLQEFRIRVDAVILPRDALKTCVILDSRHQLPESSRNAEILFSVMRDGGV